MKHEKVAVLDFGGQYAHLIANRVRRLNVYSEIVDADIPPSELATYKGIILSGGPMSVNAPGAPFCDKSIFDLGIPILGICYGHQLTQHLLGGEVLSENKEYGLADLIITHDVDFFKNVKSPSRVWMSHGDMVKQFAPGFSPIGRTSDCDSAAVADLNRHIYGVQFHPEVTHTEEGMKILDNFLNLCDVARDWSIKTFIQEGVATIQRKVGDKKVFMLVSGGVDSTVAFTLLEKALGKDRVYGLLVDHGLMRLNEAVQVKTALTAAGFENLHVADKSDEFLSALSGKTEPEAKRKIIGDLFWKVKEDVAAELHLNPDEWIMGQGTIYPDTIETGGTKHADTIKTHHNRVDLVQQMIAAGKVIEPIAQLYKDEVRTLGEELGLPRPLVWRQPFPGPGLGVRILCTSPTRETYDFTALNQSIQQFVQQKYNVSEIEICVLPIQSVGVQGDERTYRHPAVLFTPLRDWDLLERISTGITNRFSEVNRVVLNMAGSASKASETTLRRNEGRGTDGFTNGATNWYVHQADVNRNRVALLQKIDDLVTQHMIKAPDDYDIWQFPVVLAPVSIKVGCESIVLRPIVSTEAMTASFARIDWNVIDEMATAILAEPQISHLFYDLTHKPPGTIEWE